MSDYIMYNGELYHYGVKGMKWGHRKRIDTPVGQARATYKQAKKDYNKSFNTAYKYSRRHPISQFTNAKRKVESDTLYTDAYNKAVDYNKAKTAYKQAKKDRKAAIKSTYDQITKDASFAEKFNYNNATRKAAAKYVVDNNMSMSEAKQKANKEAMRNTAVLVAAYGAYTMYELNRLRH